MGKQHEKIVVITSALSMSFILSACSLSGGKLNQEVKTIEPINISEPEIKEQVELEQTVEQSAEQSEESEQLEQAEVLKICNPYYYNQLNAKQKETYELILYGLRNYKSEIEFSTTNTEELSLAFRSVLKDNPDIFYVNSCNYKIIKRNNKEITKFIPIYEFTKEEKEIAWAEIKGYETEVFKNITSDMSDYEKELIIYNIIALNTEYKIDSEYNQCMYSVVKGSSVCAGYSRMFQYLCNEAGINCTVCTGIIDLSPHQWNVVELDGKWYMVDVTNAMGALADSKDKISYYYFNVTREQMLRTVSIDNMTLLPDCNSIDCEWFNMNNVYYDKADFDRFSNEFNTALDMGQNRILIRCSNDEVFEQMENVLFNTADNNSSCGVVGIIEERARKGGISGNGIQCYRVINKETLTIEVGIN